MSLFVSKYNFKTTLSGSVKNDIGSFIGTTLNLWITLYSVDFMAILILSVHEHRILFYFVSYIVFSSVSDSFIEWYMNLTPFDWLFLFLLLQIRLFNFSKRWFASIYKCNFCMFVMCPLDSFIFSDIFISTTKFLVMSLGLSVCQIIDGIVRGFFYVWSY